MHLYVYLKTLCEYARFRAIPSSGVSCIDWYVYYWSTILPASFSEALVHVYQSTRLHTPDD